MPWPPLPGGLFFQTDCMGMRIFGLEIRRAPKRLPVSQNPYNTTGALRWHSRMTVSEILENATANACTGIISDAVASLPVGVYRRKDDGGRVLEASAPLYRLLKLRPNPGQHTFTLLKQLMMHLLLRGNAFLFKDWDGTELAGLHALNPERMEIFRMEGRNEYAYRYRLDGQVFELTRDSILHVPAMVWDGVWGLSPIEYANKAARLGNNMDDYAEHVFDGGIHSKLKVTVPLSEKNFGADDAKKLKERLVQAYGGIEHAGDPFILTQGMTADALNLPDNNGSQLVENRTYSSREVAKIFRVPLSMLGESDAKYNNNEQQARNFLQNTLNPWLRLLEQYFSDLLPVYDRADCYVEFDRNAMLQADSQIRIDNYVKQLSNGMLTMNDVNRMENRPLIDPAIGDVRFMPANLAPLTPDYVAAYMANQKQLIKGSGDDSKKKES